MKPTSLKHIPEGVTVSHGFEFEGTSADGVKRRVTALKCNHPLTPYVLNLHTEWPGRTNDMTLTLAPEALTLLYSALWEAEHFMHEHPIE